MIEGSAKVEKAPKLLGIQAGRGIAAVMVVITHALVHPLDHRNAILSMPGIYGVFLFFIISGFIMVKTTGNGSFSPSIFMRNRLQRIAPLYYFASALLAFQVLIAPWAFKTTTLDFWHIVRSIFFIPGFSPKTHETTPFFKLGWTLNFEMFFYLIFACLYMLNARKRVLIITVLFATLVTIGQLVTFQSAIPLYYTRTDLLAFVLGTWLGLAHLRYKIIFSRGQSIALFLIGLALIAPAVLNADEDLSKKIGIMLMLFIAIACHTLILIGYLDRPEIRIPNWVVKSGDASYSLYLFHMFGIGPVVAIGHKLGPAFLIPTMIAAAIAGIVAGLLGYRFVEVPIIAWFKRRRHAAKPQIASPEAA